MIAKGGEIALNVSIITVCFNSSNTIRNTIESVLTQTYKNIQYIIVDGCSNDGTVDIVKNYEEKFINSGIKYLWLSEKDNGIYDAINKGIKMASGDIVGILNSDDYFYDNNVLQDIVRALNKNLVDCIYGNLIYVDHRNNNRISRKWISKEFENGLFEKSWTPAHPTFYCRRSMYEQYGLYRIDFKIAADVELMYRFLVKHSIRSFYLDRVMVVMRKGGVSNRGIYSTLTITKEMKIAINENGGQFNIIKYLWYKALKIRELFV